MKHLSLDISTSCTGWAFGEDEEIEEHGYVRFKKDDDWKHIDLVRQLSDAIPDQIEAAETVVVEDALRKYGGMTTQRSINVLIEFNAVVQYEMRRQGKTVLGYHPSTARKNSFVGKGRRPSTYDDTKAWILDEVAEFLDLEWSRTRYDNIRKQHEDEADAVVLASAFINTDL